MHPTPKAKKRVDILSFKKTNAKSICDYDKIP
jgi:hypothetical protein